MRYGLLGRSGLRVFGITLSARGALFATILVTLAPSLPRVDGLLPSPAHAQVATVSTPESRIVATTPGFDVHEIALDVYAVIRKEPLGLANHANNVFLVGVSDVLVVDTAFTLAETRAVLEAVRSVTDKPVHYLVNTHWHDDHTFGNQVYRAAFPNVIILAHAQTRQDMATTGVANREQQMAGGAGAVAAFRSAVESGTALDGTAMSDDERAAYRSTIALAEQYLSEETEFELTLPDVVLDDRITLYQGARRIELLHVGAGVTAGDIVVHLPEERILIAGDLVDYPFPFAYRSHVAEWIPALEALRALAPRIVVPGHGPLLEGGAHLRALQELLTSVQDQTRAAVARGVAPESVPETLALDSHRDALVGQSKMGAFLFREFFAGPAASAVLGETAGP